MKRFTFISILLIYSLTAFGAKKEITNVGLTFNPTPLTIEPGDNVSFVLEAMHNAVEVSLTTWDANGTTPLAGGFSVNFGGGEVLPAQLTNGTHWYVCTTHAGQGMKGIIIVGTATGTDESPVVADISVFPNPATDLITLNASTNLLDTQYIITDQYGRQMLTGKIDSETMPLNISQLQNGMYLLQVAGKRKQTVKVIKK